MIILVNNKQELLLYKRPAIGIWGGLWSFPEMDTEEDIAAWLQNNYACEIEHSQPLEPFRHTFSHFHLDITPILTRVKSSYQIMDSADLAWYNLTSALQLGISSPIKKLLSDNQVIELIQA